MSFQLAKLIIRQSLTNTLTTAHYPPIGLTNAASASSD